MRVAASSCVRTRTVRALGVLAGIILGGGGFLIPAHAFADTPDSQTLCTAYTDGQVWQTSTRWGRVRQQLCIDYTSAYVRAMVHFQTDWPSFCSLSTGIPPSAGVSCPASTLDKLNGLTYKTVNIPIRWSNGAGQVSTYTCSFTDVDANASPGVSTITCDGSWMPIFHGVYYQVWVDGSQADVKDDGDGLKALPSETHSFIFNN